MKRYKLTLILLFFLLAVSAQEAFALYYLGGAGDGSAMAELDVEFMDIGLRVRYGGQAVKIACELAETSVSPLRIRKGGATYAIVLVDTGDSMASSVRINTSTGIKALRRYE
ncbi:MAG: hypothetical protein JSV30_05705 [Candidatus Omnitrophota bacterium]|nr:MAG: hypothetical protein JSV30_05705 [Candidatus Omnitrophota bacterium]